MPRWWQAQAKLNLYLHVVGRRADGIRNAIAHAQYNKQQQHADVAQPQRIGQRGIHICLRFVVVGGAWRLGIPVCSRPQFLDAKLVHHPLVILL